MKGKLFVWIMWILIAVLSACYGALCLYTFIGMTKLDDRGYKTQISITDTEGTAHRWGLFAATMMSFISVAFFVVFSLLVMLRKTLHANANTGYGIILASSLQTAMLLLLSSLVLHSSQETAEVWKKQKWFTDLDYLAYWGTFGLGYILTFWYVVNFLVLLFFKPAMDHHQPKPTESGVYGAAAHGVQPSHSQELPPHKVDSLPTHDDLKPPADVEAPEEEPAAKKKGMFAWGK